MTRAREILRRIYKTPSYELPTLTEMELRRYCSFRDRFIAFVKQCNEPVPVRHLARRYGITHDEVLMLVEDTDYALTVNVGIMVQGVGHAVFENEGDYTVEYLGEA